MYRFRIYGCIVHRKKRIFNSLNGPFPQKSKGLTLKLFIKYIWSLTFLEKDSNLSLKEKSILSYILQNEKISNKEAREFLDISKHEATDTFNLLLDKKYIEKFGNGKGTHYKLKFSKDDEKIKKLDSKIKDIELNIKSTEDKISKLNSENEKVKKEIIKKQKDLAPHEQYILQKTSEIIEKITD